MAIYNLEKELDRDRFKRRCNYLYTRNSFVELSEKRPKRTLEQNAYLHVCIQYLALKWQERVEYVKEVYYKRICNKDLYVFTEYDEHLRTTIERTRSSKDLTTEEMSLSIDRFKNWVALEGEALPDANSPEQLIQAYQEIENNKQYLYY